MFVAHIPDLYGKKLIDAQKGHLLFLGLILKILHHTIGKLPPRLQHRIKLLPLKLLNPLGNLLNFLFAHFLRYFKIPLNS